jgi:hypothetical protein
VRRSAEPRRQCRSPVTTGGIDLLLRREEAGFQARAGQIRGTKICACEVGVAQVDTAEVGADQQRSAQARASKVGVAQVLPG